MTVPLKPVHLKCEHRSDPLGVDILQPRLGWELQGKGRSRLQTEYRILVSSRRGSLADCQGDLWDSGRIAADHSLDLLYAGHPLASAQRAWWRVCVWDENGRPKWSDTAFWEMGMLEPADWKAFWITGPIVSEDGASAPGRDPVIAERSWLRTSIGSSPVQYLRRVFDIDRPVRRARVYASARGLYRCFINGEAADDRVFAPGWTDYKQRIEYQTYDITDSLHQGGNVIGIMLAEGWYAGYVGFTPRRQGAHYGSRPSFLGQVVLDFEDGGQQIIGSDERWRISLGPVEYSDMLVGEHYDARCELDGWWNQSYDDSCWPAAVEGWPTEAKLDAERAQAMRIIEEIRPNSVIRLESGGCLFDMGQNMVGRIKLRVKGKAGSVIRIRHGEMLTHEQQLYTANLRTARAEDIYVLKGVGVETYEPTFTYHGFRYVEVTGLQGEPDLEMVTGRVLMSATPRTGSFECSDQQVTQLYENILWGQKGNFISVPTDCPQRDERMGWTGDAQVFFGTAAYNMDIAAFMSKWMIDVEDAQRPDGSFTDIAPLILFENGGAPGWADAGVIIPWSMYVFYGDRSIIQRHWESMTAFMEGVARQNPGFLRRHKLNLNFGDWLSIDADTPKDLLATAYYAYCASLMADMARAIGRDSEAEQYSALWSDIKGAFVSEFVADDGAVAGDTQTAYALSLAFDLVPEKSQAACARKLVENIAARGGHLSCGFHGTRWLAPVLTRFGYSDIAYQLVLSNEYPSWGFSIKHGATTIWERWDGWMPEHGFQEQMNSFNHYAFGSIGQWLYGDLAGIKPNPARPGFKNILIAPQIRDGIEWCRAAFQSPRGRISVSWVQSPQQIGIDLEIPPNTTATITLPVNSAEQVTEGQRPLAGTDGIDEIQIEEAGVIVTVASGRYSFEISRE